MAALGVWVVGPFQVSHGHPSYFFLNGTSMASPHVAGTVALMAEKNPALTQSYAEDIFEDTVLSLAPGCSDVIDVFTGTITEIIWGADATGSGLIQANDAVDATLENLN